MKITNFLISSNISDIKLCEFQGGGPDPSRSAHVMYVFSKGEKQLMPLRSVVWEMAENYAVLTWKRGHFQSRTLQSQLLFYSTSFSTNGCTYPP